MMTNQQRLFKQPAIDDNDVNKVQEIVEILKAADKDRIQFQWRQINESERLSRIESKKEAIKILIRDGANINALDNAKWTPLMHASFRRLPEFIAFFIEHGADITYIDDKGRTAMTLAELNGLALEVFPAEPHYNKCR